MARSAPGRNVSSRGSREEPLGRTAYKILRERILERVLQPGEALVEAKLAEDLGMSRTPIREALSQLEQEGLVTSVANKGTFVESLRPVDIAEIYDIREVIEGLAARLLSRRVTRSQGEVLDDLARRADDPMAAVSDEVEFHSAIVRMCGSQRVVDVARQFFLQALTYDERTRRLASAGSVPVVHEGRVEGAHQAIARTIAAGDGPAAEDMVRAHVRHGKNTVARFLLGLDEYI
ncbi:MAG: GntR family transcriptional regulator [Verrucomicrobia bacterium]|nr:GntR family transcriptional regulator [Verrucomicrobiota bacterium]